MEGFCPVCFVLHSAYKLKFVLNSSVFKEFTWDEVQIVFFYLFLLLSA
jgi:hypothetical protein